MAFRSYFLECHNRNLTAAGYTTWYHEGRLLFRNGNDIAEAVLSPDDEISIQILLTTTTNPNLLYNFTHPAPQRHVLPGGIELTEGEFQRILQGAIDWLRFGRD